MYFEDDQSIPALIPIKTKKKKRDLELEQPSHLANEEVLQVFTKETGKNQPEKEIIKAEKSSKPALSQDKLEEIDKKFSNLHEKGTNRGQTERDKHDKNLTSKKEKEMQRAKFMVNDIMKKIEAKNISEELYPVTSETIMGNIQKIQAEIEQLKLEAERKENSLVSNPNNQHLRKELENLKQSIDRCVTIKELYYEKINLRNKVSILEKNIITLKEDNQNLRIQIHQDEEAVELHALGQPCQKEKELKEELLKTKLELKKVTEIKEKLENNVADIIQSFKRLYEEADTARLIVIKKLRELQHLEKNSDSGSSEKRSTPAHGSQKKSPKIPQNKDSPAYDFSKAQKYNQNVIPLNQTRVPLKEEEKTINGGKSKAYSFEEQIRRMKANQTGFSKYQYKK